MFACGCCFWGHAFISTILGRTAFPFLRPSIPQHPAARTHVGSMAQMPCGMALVAAAGAMGPLVGMPLPLQQGLDSELPPLRATAC